MKSKTFEEFYEDFKEVFAYYTKQQMIVDTFHDVATEGRNCRSARIHAGRGLHRTGVKRSNRAALNMTSLPPQFVGVANIGNSLAAIKRVILRKNHSQRTSCWHALKTNFEDETTNPTGKEINKMLSEAPKYGNDEDYADSLMTSSFRFMCDEVCK